MKYFNHSSKIEKLSFSNGNAIICAVDETSDNDTLEETSSKSIIETRKKIAFDLLAKASNIS